MIIRITTLASFLALLVCQPAMSREFADIYTDCGLGALIAPRSDAVAAVTNVTWDSGTTAISSNISSPGTCTGGQQRTAAFIYDSYESIERNLASGSGAYLDALTAFAGCEAHAYGDFKRSLRAGFAGLVAKTGYATQSRYQKAEALYGLVYSGSGAGPTSLCSAASG